MSKWHKLEWSVWLTMLGVIALFSASIAIVLLTPLVVEQNWVEPSCEYQKQMHEEADHRLFISTASADGKTIHTIYHIKHGQTPLAFMESEQVRIVASPELTPYITPIGSEVVKLTRRLLLLRHPKSQPESASAFNAALAAQQLQQDWQEKWQKQHSDWKTSGLAFPRLTIFELYDPLLEETFSIADSDGITENWVDQSNIQWIEDFAITTRSGSIFVKNPRQYRLKSVPLADGSFGWAYDFEEGEPIQTPQRLGELGMGFMSRAQLIDLGERIYAAEGCWYCHTDQTRTLIQDTVLNGLDHPAPVSTPHEYIYQHITFPGTKRNGPDLSRVGIKRSTRDWHMAHFWSPKTASPGSIMPSFRHFFDFDPRGTHPNTMGLPNWKFEALYQYLMTKGTRLAPPSQAWWLGKDPARTQERIEGKLKANAGLKQEELNVRL